MTFTGYGRIATLAEEVRDPRRVIPPAVLLYYGITNLAALRLPAEARLFPRWIPAAGLLGCLGLAFWVEPAVWMAGLALLAAGLAAHLINRQRA